MASKTLSNQKEITDFFNKTVTTRQTRLSTLKQESQNVKLSAINDDHFKSSNVENGNMISNNSLTTPKRKARQNKSENSSKKAKTSNVTKKSQKADTKMVRRGRYPVDYGPIGAIRKLDFDDCKQNDQNNNHKSFAEFLKSRGISHEDETLEPKDKINVLPLIKADDIKERLRSCKNLAELKEKLVNIDNGGEKIKNFKEMKIQYSPSKSSPKKSLLSSPIRNVGSPIKIVPASPVKNFSIPKRNLFSSPKAPSKKIEAPVELPLPPIFKNLIEVFKLIDYNSWRMNKRGEICTFDKLKQIAEEATHRNFTLDCLLKIMTISKSKPFFILSWQICSGEWKLVITPKYEQSYKCMHSFGHLLEREKQFYESLLEIVKTEHLKFIAEMKLTLKDCDQIYRWHPMFELNNVPDINPDFTLLPEKPEKRKKTILDYFNVRKSSEKPLAQQNLVESSEKIESGPFKGLSVSLLNKIKAKEAAKLAELMRRPPEKDREIRTLVYLPKIADFIDDCFRRSTTRCIEKEELVGRIAYTMPMTISESRRHLEFLSSFELDEAGTKWIKLIPLRKTHYVQIDRTISLEYLSKVFRKRIKELTES